MNQRTVLLMAYFVGFVFWLAKNSAAIAAVYFGYMLIAHGYVYQTMIEFLGSLVVLGLILMLGNSLSKALHNEVYLDKLWALIKP
jgi:hypothetical protein